MSQFKSFITEARKLAKKTKLQSTTINNDDNDNSKKTNKKVPVKVYTGETTNEPGIIPGLN